MKKVTVNIELTKGNFVAYIDNLPGCIATGDTPEAIEASMREAVELHVELSKEAGAKVPVVFQKEYELIFKYEPKALFAQYAGIITPAAMERLTGISRKQLSHYATGLKSPRADQRKKITSGLHKLGRELSRIEL